jgi:mRNA interferase RelE/StbE
MSWNVVYLPEALDDFRALDGSQRLLVRKAIEKLRTNPLPETEGGYGKWLGNKSGAKLAGFLKVKLRGAGLRIVYQLKRVDDHVLIIVIGAREDSEVYGIAEKRIHRGRLCQD